MQPHPAISSPLPTPRTARSSGKPTGEFPERIRKALRPLLADNPLLERTALKIQNMQGSQWTFSHDSRFFDIEAKIDRIVAHFAHDGLTRDAFLRAAARRVMLFCQNPETLIDNVEGVTDHFSEHGLTCRVYLRAALRQPKLFHQKPETVIGHIERMVDHYNRDGLTCERYLRAATQEPLLFLRKLDSIIKHVDLIVDLRRKGIVNLPGSPDTPKTDSAAVLDLMLMHPMLFVMPEENITRPELYALAITARPSRKLMIPSCHVSGGRLRAALALWRERNGHRQPPARRDGQGRRQVAKAHTDSFAHAARFYSPDKH